MKYEISPLNESAIVVQLGSEINEETHHAVQILSSYLEEYPFEEMIDFVPAFTTVTIFYDPLILLQDHTTSPYETICGRLDQIFDGLELTEPKDSKTVEIPVCYGGELGPDIEEVASRNKLDVEEVIRIHTDGDYLVHMIGFAPGFPYLGGMSEQIATPRRDDPRTAIPAGSVGIAGSQTGVYPIETPGGWQLIGQTPYKLFDLTKDPPSLLEAGDRIRFKAITLAEFKELKGESQS